jgi:aminopeptidase N
MKTDTPQTIYLKDYTPYPYDIRHIDLNFDIHDGYTIVTSTLKIAAKPGQTEELFLNGEHLELMSVTLNGEAFEGYEADGKGLRMPCPGPDEFILEIKTRIKPEENTRLEGLYKSGDTYCTQCEAEGFRTITYYPDRPDVLTTFTTRIEAKKDAFPVLLGNGNRIDHGEAEHGRHFAIWHDPFLKPCYLFALVAGDLAHIEDSFTTKSGRKVELYIYVRPGDEDQCDHAMESLKKSMKWDEDVYGLEYDLDLFNIVAVSDFNMGAMENKSLNIFNTALVLAHQDTATDSDFTRVESVIAHEYFHNWSGNRITCRDWFQLSLKEGLTVFRDQEFSADMNSRAVQRIDDVSHLRRLQFPEDSGPLAHPIRPDNYIEINNFYTMTVYEKGAEVIRMMHTILGPENYRKGTDLYFSRHDGQAATCEDFVACLEEASGIDLSQFKLWYEQAGTPKLHFRGIYHAENNTYTAELSQTIPDTPGQTNKKPMHIPVALGLLGHDGQDIRLISPPPSSRRRPGSSGSEEQDPGLRRDDGKRGRDDSIILHLTEEKQSFVLENIAEKPVASVLRNFSAPVRLEAELSDDELAFLMVHDSDAFNRWEAGQEFAMRAMEREEHEQFLAAYGTMLEDTSDPAFLARAMALPSVSMMGQRQDDVDPPALHKKRKALRAAIKRTHRKALDKLYKDFSGDETFSVTAEAMGRRALKNVTLDLLTATHGTGCRRRAKEQYDSANNMTDRIAALSILTNIDCPETDDALEHFYERFEHYPLVIDKWFSLQACAVKDGLINNIKKLSQHTDFNIKNPNRVRSLYAAFAINNPVHFHAADGSGYVFLTEAIIALNSINPQIAARLLTPLREWRRYTPDRQEMMKAALDKILATPNLSPDVFEIASKSINA